MYWPSKTFFTCLYSRIYSLLRFAVFVCIINTAVNMQTVFMFLKLYRVVLPTNPDGICLNVLLSIPPIQTLLADSSQALFCCLVL